MLKAKKIRLDVNAQDAATLEFMQIKCRGLYNWWVKRLREGQLWKWQDAKKTLAESRKYDPDLNQVYGKRLSEVYFRLDEAMPSFWRRCLAGEKSGFPRVRPHHQFFTLCYSAMYVKIEGKTVLLPTGGGRGKKDKPYPTIVARLMEAVAPGYKEAAISRDTRGHYYAFFVYEVRAEPKVGGGVVAFDRQLLPAVLCPAGATHGRSRAVCGCVHCNQHVSIRLDRKAAPADVDSSIQTARSAATAFGHRVAA